MIVTGTLAAPISRVTLKIGDETHHRQVGERLELDAKRFDVDGEVGIERELDGKWGSLAGEPMAKLFRDVAPGDHVKCELRGFELEAGARVTLAVDGTRVVRIALGDDETVRARLERATAPKPPVEQPVVKPPAEPPPRKPFGRTIIAFSGLGLVGVACAIATWIDPRTIPDKGADLPVGLTLILPSVYLIAIALMLWLTRPWFEAMDTATTLRQFRAPWSLWGVTYGLSLGVIVGDLCLGLPGMLVLPKGATGIRMLVYAGMISIPIIIAMRAQRVPRRLARIVAGGMRGTLVADRAPLACSVRYDRHVQVTGTGDRQSTSIWYDGIRAERSTSSFAVEIENKRYTVNGDRVFWGAPLEYHRLSDKDRGGNVVARTHAELAPGASVLVRGRADGDTFHANGAESFVIFGATGNASAALRGLRARWYAGLGVLFGLAIGSIAFGVYMLTLGPPAPKQAVPAERPL